MSSPSFQTRQEVVEIAGVDVEGGGLGQQRLQEAGAGWSGEGILSQT